MKGQQVQSYRDRLHRERAHRDDSEPHALVDYRDSFSRVYFSSGAFLAAEYVTETSLSVVPSGLIFPLGFLIFWAVYYTYYKPSFLETQLFFPERWNWNAIPVVILGVAIWFVKASLHDAVRIAKFCFGVRRKPPALAPALTRAGTLAVVSKKMELPPEVKAALEDLGFEGIVSWELIQHRYRVLAKRYHPDLNPEITRSGNRFMRLDASYRRLASVRHRYFISSK